MVVSAANPTVFADGGNGGVRCAHPTLRAHMHCIAWVGSIVEIFGLSCITEGIGGERVTYISNPHHRSAGHNAVKSQWNISIADEMQCYLGAVENHWMANNSYWGLHLIEVRPVVLGSAPSNDALYIAKFVSNQGIWHGYPVAHWLSPYDKPQMPVLESWVAGGFINRAKKARIHRGKKCAL